MTPTEEFRLFLSERGQAHTDMSETVTVVPHCEGFAVAEEEGGTLTVSLVREMTPAQAMVALMGPSLLTWREAEPAPESVSVGGRRYVRDDVAETNWYRWFGDPRRAASSVSKLVDYVEAIGKADRMGVGVEFRSDLTDALHDQAPYALCHTDTLAAWLEGVA